MYNIGFLEKRLVIFSVLGTSLVRFINMHFWVFKFLVFEIFDQPLLEEND